MWHLPRQRACLQAIGHEMSFRAAPATDAGGADEAWTRPAVRQARRQRRGLVAARKTAEVGRSLRTEAQLSVSDGVPCEGRGQAEVSVRRSPAMLLLL